MTALARTTDPQTSHDAAASVNRANSRDAVLFYLRNYGPMTDEALNDLRHYGGAPGTDQRIRTARKELTTKRYGCLVRDTGRTETVRSGRQATVWEVA